MIDSHCHLDHSPLKDNLDEVISRSKDIGIEKLLTISTNIKSFENIIKLVEKDAIIFGTFGIHPHETDKELISKVDIVKKIMFNDKIIGVGETGLDFYYNNSNKNNQILSFKNHIEAALELEMPVIVHSRNAEEETYEILKDYSYDKLKILMHCYTGSRAFAEKLMKLNAYFSASGIITFKNSLELQNTFKIIPGEKLLIETDSPFLSPVPMRGKKNEPSYIKFTLEKLAEIKNISTKHLDSLTTKNFEKLFFN